MSEQGFNEPAAIENASRLAARGFVIAGGVFWMIAAFFGPYAYREMSLADSLSTAAWPFLATVLILLVGWTYERLASVLLLCAVVAVVFWGVQYGWEPGVWLLVSVVLIAPMVISGVLFSVAAGVESRRIEDGATARVVASGHPEGSVSSM